MSEVVTRENAKSGELVEKKIDDLIGMLDQIGQSLKETEGLIKKAEVVENAGRLESIFSGITGKSDKELASIVKGLGANVVVTQQVVKFLIELAQQKSIIQEGFLGALDKKIEDQYSRLQKLDQNDGSLDENAKQVETAVLTLYKQVHAQVESEVALRQNVDQNMLNIGLLFDAIDSKGQTDAEQSEQISSLIQAMRDKTYKLEELRLSLSVKEEHLAKVANEVQTQSNKQVAFEERLRLKAEKLEQTMDEIKENTLADKLREERINKLEIGVETLSQCKESQIPAYVATSLAVIALSLSVYSLFV